MAYANVQSVLPGPTNPLKIFVLSSSGNRYRLKKLCPNPEYTRKKIQAIKSRGKIDVRHWIKLPPKAKPASKASNYFRSFANIQSIQDFYSGKAIAAAPTSIETITSIYSGE